LDQIETHGLRLSAILNTHGHVDHIAGNEAMKAAFPQASLLIGRNEAHLLRDPNANLSASFRIPLISPAADRLVCEGERIQIAGLDFEVREIPGHSPGSVVFLCDEFDPAIVFGGDVLFAGSIGRTDLGGDLELLLTGIRNKLFSLPDSTTIYPGHGPASTIGVERRSNPFVGERARLFDPRR
jgi:glyoxylase-like metal-dependent hydrolase (beta-lactamase superfamily II)